MKFSDYIEKQEDELRRAGDGYEELSNRSKSCIDFAVQRYVDEYAAKQQAIAFLKWGIKAWVIYPTTDETVCVEGFEHNHPAFENAAASRYDQFIEQQNKDNDK